MGHIFSSRNNYIVDPQNKQKTGERRKSRRFCSFIRKS